MVDSLLVQALSLGVVEIWMEAEVFNMARETAENTHLSLWISVDLRTLVSRSGSGWAP